MEEITKILKVLSDKNRLRIIFLLSKESMCVCQLSYILGITQPSVSKHIKKIKEAGILNEEKQSYWTNYSIRIESQVIKQILPAIRKCCDLDGQIINDQKKIKSASQLKICCNN